MKHKIAILSFCANLLILGSVSFPAVKAETLDQLLQRQAELRRQAEASKKKIEQKQREVADLQQAIASLDEDIAQTESQIASTQEQISLTDAVIANLAEQVSHQQTAIDLLNSRLRSAYISLYEMSQQNPFEILASTGSFDEAVRHAQYVQAVQAQLQADILEANTLLADLNSKKQEQESQKSALESLNNQLSSSRASLSRQKSQKNDLLGATRGEQASYEKLLEDIKKESAQLSDEIYRKRQELGGSVDSNGTGGYPYTAIDAPDPYGFLTRECTSYAAWAWNVRYGRPWYRGSGPSGTGDAKNWGNLAARQGYATGTTPMVTALVFWPAGPYIGQWGHVAVVEKVNGNGTIDVSEYNWVRYSYSYRSGINPNDPRYGQATYIYP